MGKVSIIIVNWNGKRFLKNCLSSLNKLDYPNKEIIIVDNGSTDGSVELIKNYKLRIKNFSLIENQRNLGYTEGNNIGFQQSTGKAILLLNNDTIVGKNLLNKMVKALYAKKDIGAVQPKIVMYPQKNLIDSIGTFFLLSGFLYHYGREKDSSLSRFNIPMEIFSAKGTCILFKKEVLDKVGLFDKDYFAYFEETDLCHRIWLAGYKIVYNPKAIIYHKGGGAAKQIGSSFIQYNSFKNRICTYIKNLSLKNLIRTIPLTIVIYQLAFWLYIFTGNFKVAWSVQKAIIWNMVHIRDTLRKREHVQNKIRTVSDDEFLPKVTKQVRLSYYYYLFAGLKNYRD